MVHCAFYINDCGRNWGYVREAWSLLHFDWFSNDDFNFCSLVSSGFQWYKFLTHQHLE